MKKIVYFWLPTILWLALIFFLSSFHRLQASTTPWQDFITRKFAHFFEYAVLYVLLYRSFVNTTRLPKGRVLLFSLLLTFLYALSDEYHQTFVSGRTGKLFDLGVDFSGGIFGFVFVKKIMFILPLKFQNVLRKAGLVE